MLPISPIQIKATQTATAAKKTSAAGAKFSVPQDTSPPQQALGNSGVYSMGNLAAAHALFLQEIPDPLEKKKEHAKRGQNILKLLDDLKSGMVIAASSEEQQIHQLNQLKAELAQLEQNPIDNDPYLASLMAQIEVRAAVELAKRGL